MIDTAIILAGGLGTRLRPLTDSMPKPLLPMKGKPIVHQIIENLKKFGVTDVILSIGYKAEQIQEYFGNGAQFGVRIRYSIENTPLGTGGAIKQAASGLQKPFFLLWGDNLMDIDGDAMYKAYLRHASQITMALTPREDVENFGVAKLEQKKIITFVEKPKREEAPSNLINAGAFIINPDILKILPEGVSSIERDCFEKIAPLREISAYIHPGQWFPTDTLEKYQMACEQFRPLINLAEKKVIIADVDETICDSCQQISENMAEQINAMIRKGYQFAFVSGTDFKNLQGMISSRLREEHHLLCATGTCYVKVQGGNSQTMYTHSLSSAEKKEIISAIEKVVRHFNIISLTTKEDQIQDRDSQITLSAIGRHAPSDIKATYDPDGSKRKVWIEFLQPELGTEKYEFKIGGTTSIDITRKGLDKEWAIREFARYNDIPLSNILFFGDKIYPGGNDYPASKIVDCIAVKNPQDTLHQLRKLL
ncbi:HAD-IIB family hydrolase [Candidatus Woesearchaeota archaeon]|nr:HAD-IIB family hydrolase [Candidatus Woesearchaeota archaeon]